MSAGFAPPNPGAPKSNKNAPTRFNLRSNAPRLALAGVAVGAVYTFYATRAPKPVGTPAPNPLRTPGVKNIEGAYSNGGATSTHTKAYGGTPQGSKDDGLRQGAGTGKPKGFDEDGVGVEQRPDQQTKIGDTYKDMAYGSSKGK